MKTLHAALLLVCLFSAPAVAEPIEVVTGPLRARLELDPFRLSVSQDGLPILADAPRDPLDPSARYGTLGFAVDGRVETNVPLLGYGLFVEVPVRWFHATRVVGTRGDRLVVATDDPLGRGFLVAVRAAGEGVIEVDAELENPLGATATGWSFARGDGERFLGFGERSDAVDQTGNVVASWSEEGPFSAGGLRPLTDPIFGERWQGPPPFGGATNFPMPWFVSSRGHGFLLDSTAYNTFRLDRDSAWNVETREPRLRFRVFAGPTPADVLRRLVAAEGAQPEPAPWFFGPWYQPTGPDEFRRELAQRWRAEDVPMTVAQTYTHYLPCGAHWNQRASERERADFYHSHGYKVTTYVNSFVCRDHPAGAYQEAEANGYFVKTLLGTTYPIPYLAAYESPTAIVDFTNPAAATWWQGLIGDALEDGYDGWMEDFGEYVPPDARMHDGRTGLAAHNDYCTLYHAASHALTWPLRGPDFAQFVRCGYSGTARNARIVWGGDPTEDDSAADGLAAAVSQGISMGLSGVAYWGSDVGGFHSIFTSGRVDRELLVRWLEVGAFSGILRAQAEGYARPGQGERAQIWDDDVIGIWRKYAKLRTQLFPYVWAAAQEYRETGMPIMRHLALGDAADVNAYEPVAEYEFLFGPDLLVAPVVDMGARKRALYLPRGDWFEFWRSVTYDEASGAFAVRPEAVPIAGGRVIEVAAPLEEIPIFVRAGACLPLLPPETDTLTDLPAGPDVVNLSDALAAAPRVLAFGDCAS